MRLVATNPPSLQPFASGLLCDWWVVYGGVSYVGVCGGGASSSGFPTFIPLMSRHHLLADIHHNRFLK